MTSDLLQRNGLGATNQDRPLQDGFAADVPVKPEGTASTRTYTAPARMDIEPTGNTSLTLPIVRYLPPASVYYDETVLADSYFRGPRCQKCWSKPHHVHPEDCRRTCRMCKERVPKTPDHVIGKVCPLVYCTREWWAERNISLDQVFQVRPDAQEQGVLVSMGMILPNRMVGNTIRPNYSHSFVNDFYRTGRPRKLSAVGKRYLPLPSPVLSLAKPASQSTSPAPASMHSHRASPSSLVAHTNSEFQALNTKMLQPHTRPAGSASNPQNSVSDLEHYNLTKEREIQRLKTEIAELLGDGEEGEVFRAST